MEETESAAILLIMKALPPTMPGLEGAIPLVTIGQGPTASVGGGRGEQRTAEEVKREERL